MKTKKSKKPKNSNDDLSDATQSIDCEITDFSSILKDDLEDNNMPTYKQKHFLMPSKNFRMLITGPSGCGKSNLLMNFLLKFIHFDKLYVYTRHMEQDCYRKLRRVLENVEERTCEQILTIDNDPDNIISPDELDSSKQNVVVFDDFVLANQGAQKKMVELYIRGRHANCSCFYLSQMYHKVPRDIRLNSTHLSIFDVCNRREMSLLCAELNTSMSKDQFHHVYKMCTQEPYDFMYIDRESKHFPYRRNLDKFYINNK
jgi:energy-coupling factor transporter ATP-binding protein EcfA2